MEGSDPSKVDAEMIVLTLERRNAGNKVLDGVVGYVTASQMVPEHLG